MSVEPGELIETVTLEVRAPSDGTGRISAATPGPTAVHDIWAFRAAVVAVGVGLLVFLVGAAVVFAVTKEVPDQYWTAGSAISGALIGILVPSKTTQTGASAVGAADANAGKGSKAARFATLASEKMVENLRMLILFGIFVISVVLGATLSSTHELHSLAAASAGALIGLMVPAPTVHPSGAGTHAPPGGG